MPPKFGLVSDATLCNCYKHVREHLDELPRMHAIQPNTEAKFGAVAIEYFGSVKHVSLVYKVEENGVWITETNYHRCQFGERFIPFSSPRLAGFWHSS